MDVISDLTRKQHKIENKLLDNLYISMLKNIQKSHMRRKFYSETGTSTNQTLHSKTQLDITEITNVYDIYEKGIILLAK